MHLRPTASTALINAAVTFPPSTWETCLQQNGVYKSIRWHNMVDISQYFYLEPRTRVSRCPHCTWCLRSSMSCLAHLIPMQHCTSLFDSALYYSTLHWCWMLQTPKTLEITWKTTRLFSGYPTQPETSVSFQTNTEQCNSVTFTAHTNDCWGPMPISVLRLHLRQCNLHRHAETSGRCPGYMAAVWLLWFNCNSCHASYSRKWWLKVARSFPTSVSKTCDDRNWDLVTCYSSKHR